MNHTEFVPVFVYQAVNCEVEPVFKQNKIEIIKEIFIPSHQIVYNEKGHINTFHQPCNELAPLKEIQIPLEQVEKIKKIFQMKSELERLEWEVTSYIRTLK